MEKKQGCLLKIKAELLKQLEERKSQVVSLEKSLSELREEVREKDEMINSLQSLQRNKLPRKKFLANIKSHFQKPRGLRSVSMPGNLDSVGRSKNTVRNSFVEAIKRKSYKLRSNQKAKEPQEPVVLNYLPESEGGGESGDYQSFTSRW